MILLASLGGMIGAAYLFFNTNDTVTITKVKDVKKAASGISTVNGNVNRAMSENEVDKY